jgi:hypothetical protein
MNDSKSSPLPASRSQDTDNQAKCYYNYNAAHQQFHLMTKLIGCHLVGNKK